MTHANAPLTPEGPRRLASLIADKGWPVRRAADRFQRSPSTASKGARRYAATELHGRAPRGPAATGERFNRTLAAEWAYATTYASEAERAAAYEHWLHHYNHHRPHTGIGGDFPSARVRNLTGKYA